MFWLPMYYKNGLTIIIVPLKNLRQQLADESSQQGFCAVVGGIMISYLTHLDMEYWGRECCGMSGATTSQYWAGSYMKNDITFIFISILEEEIRKMPDICLHLITPSFLITPSLFHATR